MKVIADTNLLVSVLTGEDPRQFALASQLLRDAEVVVFSIVVLCEAVWVLRRFAKWPKAEIARAFRTLLADPRVVIDRTLAEPGLAMLEAGGDFADGVIAADGRRKEDAVFATFDRQAARLLEAQGVPVTPARLNHLPG